LATYTTRNSLTKPGYSDAADIGVINTDLDTIDAALAKSEWAKAAAPTAGDDSADGYAVGSWWYDTTAHELYSCEDNTKAAAVWNLIYPQGSSAHTAAAAPTVNDDANDGYVIGSMWVDTGTDYVYIAADVTVGAAVWQKVYPQQFTPHTSTDTPTVNDDTSAGYIEGSMWVETDVNAYYIATDVAKGAAVWRKGMMLGSDGKLTADWDAGAKNITTTGVVTANTFEAKQSTGTAPFTVSSTTKVTSLNADQLDGLDDTAFLKQSLADAAGDVIVASGSDTWAKLASPASNQRNGSSLRYCDLASNSVSWQAPWKTWIQQDGTRVSNTSFKVTDTGNAQLLDSVFRRGTVIRWTESTVAKYAMISAAGSYASDEVTWNILGNTMASIDADSLYISPPGTAQFMEWVLPGTMTSSAGSYIGRRHFAPNAFYPLAIGAFCITQGTGTGNNTFNVQDDTSGIATVSLAASTGNNLVAATAPGTAVAIDSTMTVDCSAVTATTPCSEVYIRLYYVYASELARFIST
jgi:hypothetical protein